MTQMIHIQAAATLALIWPLSVQAGSADEQAFAALEQTHVELAADTIDSVLTAVADSARARSGTYRWLAVVEDPRIPRDPERWLESRTTRGNTTGVRTWPADIDAPPAFQAPNRTSPGSQNSTPPPKSSPQPAWSASFDNPPRRLNRACVPGKSCGS